MLPQTVHEKQKAALMDAVVRVVVENGISSATARNIANVSGVNAVYIYRYFKNLEDLIAKTFDYADVHFLNFILENFSIIEYESVDYQMRCRMLFQKCWDFLIKYPDWLIFCLRYYYSADFQKMSYDVHVNRYSVLIEKMRPACHPNVEVKTVLHHILDTLCGQARKQIIHPQDPQQAQDDTFWLLFSVIKYGKGI